MDGFTGFKTATTEELPDAVASSSPPLVQGPVDLEQGITVHRDQQAVRSLVTGLLGRDDRIEPNLRAVRRYPAGASRQQPPGLPSVSIAQTTASSSTAIVERR